MSEICPSCALKAMEKNDTGLWECTNCGTTTFTDPITDNE